MEKKKELNRLSRRHFIRNSVLAASGISLVPSFLSSCQEKFIDFIPEGEFGFLEGVASFDPTQDRVILWSRYTPASNEKKRPLVLLDVAKDADFKDVVVSQAVEIDTENDSTINVDVRNLSSNTSYFYRFRNEISGAVSVVGKTRTLPASGQVSEVKLAVVSCANYQAGLFNVYGAVAESDADVVIHLGDYIYEYGIGGYGTSELTTALGRAHQPEGEIIRLADYRARYRQYRRDEQLQKAHQLKPFICVWDDHEITNDAYKEGAQNHQPDEGDFAGRKINALQAWHEYLPARVDDKAKIYRAFDFAGLVNLMMLDTRIIGRDKQLEYQDYLTAGGLDSQAFLADWQNAERSLLGTEQRNWLMSQLSSNNAKWQVLGNQVLMGKIFIPAELLLYTAQISTGNPSAEVMAQYNALVVELVTIKSRILQGDPTVSDTERARVETVLPYNLDAWDGYPVEREMILAAGAGKKLVSLAGDTHNAWHSKLTNGAGQERGVEFATASVTSPGLEAVFGDNPATLAGMEQAFGLLVDDLQYLNASQRGFLLLTFKNSEASADWHFISTLAAKNTQTTLENTATVV